MLSCSLNIVQQYYYLCFPSKTVRRTVHVLPAPELPARVGRQVEGLLGHAAGEGPILLLTVTQAVTQAGDGGGGAVEERGGGVRA